MKLQNYNVFCVATGRLLGRVLAYSDHDARQSAAAYGWRLNIKVKLS